MRTEARIRVLAAAAAFPVVIATVGVLALSVADFTGQMPSALSYGPPQNMAEAAGWANGAEVLRRFRLGEDPTRIETVRSEVISARVRQVTALEAAVWSRHVEVVILLDQLGAIVGDESRHHLACLASDNDSPDIVQYLSPGRKPACEPNQARGEVFARSDVP